MNSNETHETDLFGSAVVARRRLWLASTAGSARAATRIKIGAPFNVTGALSSLDAPALNGAKLKAKEINDAGGVLRQDRSNWSSTTPRPTRP